MRVCRTKPQCTPNLPFARASRASPDLLVCEHGGRSGFNYGPHGVFVDTRKRVLKLEARGLRQVSRAAGEVSCQSSRLASINPYDAPPEFFTWQS